MYLLPELFSGTAVSRDDTWISPEARRKKPVEMVSLPNATKSIVSQGNATRSSSFYSYMPYEKNMNINAVCDLIPAVKIVQMFSFWW